MSFFVLSRVWWGSRISRRDGKFFWRDFSHRHVGGISWGGVGVVIDGCPPRLPLSEADIQPELDRRRPGQSDIVTPRKGGRYLPDPLRSFRGVRRWELPSRSWCEIPTPGPRPTGKCKRNIGPRMPTLLIRRNMAYATGREADGRRRVKPSDGSLQVRWPRRCLKTLYPELEILAYVIAIRAYRMRASIRKP